ncbi:spore coat U domain-containing protein [Xylophilus sp. GOD-11R]|uniref:Csu type fimbrial protein n=1 Tax=Xylophilus sp. GOD-11R TaxID=3089814 RepID=UPI00298BED66|nr:spore coat U domain-containing protein [Xylophilus sp. GOD-11R]WPB56888.1 spore coat U domain-containing protein [Xylophilus sp. GOD-11R]
MKHGIAIVAALLAGLCSSAGACTFAESGNSLGNVSSFLVRSGPPRTGTANVDFNCNGVLLALGSGVPTLSAAIAGPVTGLTLKNGTDSIPYTITANNGQPYTNGQLVISLNGTAVVSLLNASSARVPFNIVTGTSANVAAGVYSDTLTVLWNWQNICEGLINALNVCVGVPSSGVNVPRTLTVSMTVTNDCAINAPDIQFGAAPLLTAFPTVSQNIGLLCTKGLVYTVGLSTGADPSGGRRRMSSGANRLQYDIFKPDTTVWGATGQARANGIGIADGLNTQLMPYTARIYTDQPAPAAGTYTDNITVDVGF